jgi:hypothetical protein
MDIFYNEYKKKILKFKSYFNNNIIPHVENY